MDDSNFKNVDLAFSRASKLLAKRSNQAVGQDAIGSVFSAFESARKRARVFHDDVIASGPPECPIDNLAWIERIRSNTRIINDAALSLIDNINKMAEAALDVAIISWLTTCAITINYDSADITKPLSTVPTFALDRICVSIGNRSLKLSSAIRRKILLSSDYVIVLNLVSRASDIVYDHMHAYNNMHIYSVNKIMLFPDTEFLCKKRIRDIFVNEIRNDKYGATPIVEFGTSVLFDKNMCLFIFDFLGV